MVNRCLSFISLFLVCVELTVLLKLTNQKNNFTNITLVLEYVVLLVRPTVLRTDRTVLSHHLYHPSCQTC